MGTYWLITAIILGAIFTYLNNQKKFVDSFYKNLTDEQLYKETIIILNKILALHDKNSDFIYSGLEDYDDLKQTISVYKESLIKYNFETILKLRSDFAPTGLFQELSIQNEWTEAYTELVDKFNIIYNTIEERLKNYS
ncbi:hypothetical protein DIS18_11370 [Algibacter marinivivus]|uniref:Uncharacterized protein n=1 Tax=Algibacter marinivivus TaxID=2100723 RepID=A0A2U2X4X4_9FLAO|nr:hypothetical protein [Algibacter marinivivus]PWH82820.1 hypothetical protein DIS18_11370 [Algibacter marinivivus]